MLRANRLGIFLGYMLYGRELEGRAGGLATSSRFKGGIGTSPMLSAFWTVTPIARDYLHFSRVVSYNLAIVLDLEAITKRRK